MHSLYRHTCQQQALVWAEAAGCVGVVGVQAVPHCQWLLELAQVPQLEGAVTTTGRHQHIILQEWRDNTLLTSPVVFWFSALDAN